jgi:molybdenum cofactor synthesis domain-containing protein
MARTAAVLLIGNELLGGKIRDTNLQPLAQLLRRLGVQLRRVVMALDDLPALAAEIHALAASHDLLFTSGGVGPTHDDVTLAAVAAAFHVPLVSDPELERIVRAHFGPRTSEGHLAMTRVPEGTRLLQGASPNWPATVFRNVWVLPGLPEAFLDKLQTLKPHLDATVAAFPDVDIGSYPTWSDPDYNVKLTFDGTDPARLDQALRSFCALLPPAAITRID